MKKASMEPIRQGSAGYQVNEVILHTPATPGTWWKNKTLLQMRSEIDLWHRRDRGFKKIGYHVLVHPNGEWIMGRNFTEIGAHVKERNRGTIGICMINVETIEKMGKFEDFYTAGHRAAVKKLIASLPGIKWVTGHNDYANKLCPGFKVKDEDWLP